MKSRDPSPHSVLAAAVIRLLAERPQSVEELAKALTDEGLRLGPWPVEYVEDLFDEVDELRDVGSLAGHERLFWAPALLAGSVFTHAISADEVAHDLLLATPDLLPLGALIPLRHTPVSLWDGSDMHPVMAEFDGELLAQRAIPADLVLDDAWLLEPGWFAKAGITAPGTVTVDVVDGKVRISRCDIATFDELRAARARAAIHGVALAIDSDAAHEIAGVVAAAIAEHSTLFGEPLPPIGALLPHAGFTIQGDFLCPPGVDLQALRWANYLQHLAQIHRLDDLDQAEAVLVLTDLVATTKTMLDAFADNNQDELRSALAEAFGGLGYPSSSSASDTGPPTGRATVRAALDRLAEPAVAEAAAVQVLETHLENVPALELTAELLEPMVTHQTRPAMRWLRAKAQERGGRVLEAEQSLEAAYSMNPQWLPVLADLARFASDRGDAERGIALLHRAGIDADDNLAEILASHRATDRPDLGRNDQCWCGSGRRYKACHRGREQLDLATRADWLYSKAWLHLTDWPSRDLLIDLAHAWVGSEDPRQVIEALGEDAVIDVALFEGGVFADFVATRGVLLPRDEQLLADQWLLVERSVYEVESIQHNHGFSARDIRTGDRSQVSERLATRQLKVGDLLLVRFVPNGQDTVIFGGIELIDLARRDSLVDLLDGDPDPLALIEFIAAMHAPPTIVNADGGELVICEVRLHLPDPNGVAVWLDSRLTSDHDRAGPRVWHELVDSTGGSSIRATLTLEGDELTLNTMSEERLEVLLEALRDAWPELVILEERRDGLGDLAASNAPSMGTGSIDPQDVDPELAVALREYIRGYEERWLDEPIPALGGVTPREAAGDPSRRDDLERLLQSFPADDGQPGQMSATRLRADLGLN